MVELFARLVAAVCCASSAYLTFALVCWRHPLSRPTCAAITSPFSPTLLPRFHEEPWSHRPPEDEEAILAAEELAWDKKMSALRQPATKGPSPGNVPVEQTEEDQEDEESASDDFMEPNNRTDGSQALEWDIEGMSAETDDFQ